MDTDVLYAAFASDSGASRVLLNEAIDGTLKLAASTSLFLEYEAVLCRAESLERIGLSRDEVVEALDLLAGIIEPVGLHYQWRPVAKDPDDDFVIETAVNAVADMVVSFNLKDMAAGAALFGIEVVRPGTLVRRLKDE
ncbi:putative toxin-antitoxin system toxin component, PIN family [Kordiimonas marina]|uniref:putative toxin-antitoxin system toxin component, PIN family n=1 Tax=Kordiimonas marina TaxID=2872312 RepID=UPI001FF101AF|nr:putative toxin-antitoxin system toxin component, PIN family [Kordiimonas marina]MCJ9427453.1 putative toxin-antitoxin system toxin component, PIN family [Kordiimonas marina]